MKNILVCLDGRIGFGGTFIAYWNLYGDLIKENQIDFVTFRWQTYPNDSEIVQKISSFNGMVYEILRDQPIKEQYRQIDQILSNKKYDVIHINSSALLYFLIPITAASKRKVSVRIVHAHSNGEDKSRWKHWVMNAFFKPYIIQHATHFLACSVEAGDVKFTKSVFSKKGIVLNNAIDVERFSGAKHYRTEARAKLGIAIEQILLGSVGRCEPEKNQIFLIDVLAEMLNCGKDAKLLLIGEGTQRQACVRRAAELNVSDRVVFLDNQTNVEYWLSAMDVFLFPSFYEGFGIAALEAQAASLPVICSYGISRKVNVTGNVIFMNQGDTAQEWVDQVQRSLKTTRESGGEKIKQAGYDIHSSALALLNIYNSGETKNESSNS